MGNVVQCDVWCESQYDGEATSCGSRTKDHKPDSWQIHWIKVNFWSRKTEIVFPCKIFVALKLWTIYSNYDAVELLRKALQHWQTSHWSLWSAVYKAHWNSYSVKQSPQPRVLAGEREEKEKIKVYNASSWKQHLEPVYEPKHLTESWPLSYDSPCQTKHNTNAALTSSGRRYYLVFSQCYQDSRCHVLHR